MGKHRRKKSKVSDICRSASSREQQQNGNVNRKGDKRPDEKPE